MIKLRENKNSLLIFFFKRYFKHLLKKNFRFIFLRNKNLLTETLELSKRNKIPVILCLNHSNWWDAPLIFYLAYSFFYLDGYCFMELKQLEEYPFFNRIGAIPIAKDNIKSALRSLNFGVQIAKDKNKVLAIFPQGELIKNSMIPYKLYSGIAYLINRLYRCILVLSYIDYRFSLMQKPDIYIDFFKKYHFNLSSNLNRKELIKNIEYDYKDYYLEFESKFTGDVMDDFQIILRGKKSFTERAFPFKAKVDSSLFSDL